MPTATDTWPTLAEARAITEQLDIAFEAVELMSQRLRRLTDLDFAPSVREDAQPPTTTDLGVLSYYVERTALAMATAERELASVRAVRDEVATEIDFESTDGS